MKEKILNGLGCIVGLLLCAIATIVLFTSSDFVSAVFNGCIFIVLGTIAGLIFGRIINPVVGAYIARNIYWSSSNIKAPPPEFPQIRAKIAKGEYSEAEGELRELLAKDNGNPHIVLLLAELFIDKIRDLRKAEGLLKAYLSKKERSPDDLKFVMMLADVHIEQSKPDLALAVLLDEAKRGYDKTSLNSLRNRISALS